MRKNIITHFKDRDPRSEDNISAGFNIGQHWFNELSGEEFVHGSNGVWVSIVNVDAERYTNLTPTDSSIGGISVGSTFSGKTFQEMFDSLLYPKLTPTLTNPSSTFTVSINTYYEVGQTINVLTFNSGFNRGSINPAYGTSLFISNDYGVNFLQKTIPEVIFVYGISISKTGRYIALSSNTTFGNVLYSKDFGNTWSTISFPNQTSYMYAVGIEQIHT